MLNLDLMQSRGGFEICQIGKFEGEQKGKQAGLVEGERLVIARLLEDAFWETALCFANPFGTGNFS
ncbi:MAG: hypothetical protein R3E08_06030 [Thiotrichaceae bacterium]